MPQDKSHDWHPCLTSGHECKRTRFACDILSHQPFFSLCRNLQIPTVCLKYQANALYESLIGKLWGGQVSKLQEGFQPLHLLWSELIQPTPSQNFWRMISTGKMLKAHDSDVSQAFSHLYLKIFYSHINGVEHAGKCQNLTAKSCGCYVRQGTAKGNYENCQPSFSSGKPILTVITIAHFDESVFFNSPLEFTHIIVSNWYDLRNFKTILSLARYCFGRVIMQEFSMDLACRNAQVMSSLQEVICVVGWMNKQETQESHS